MKSRYHQDYNISRDNEKVIPEADAFYWHAIENADGVPFKVIFIQETENVLYFKVGAGIRQLLGISPDDFTEKQFNGMIEEIIPLPGNIPVNRSELYKKFISGEIKRYKADLLVRTADGKRKWVREASQPIDDKNTGKVTGAFGILYDITDSRLKLDMLNKIRLKEAECDNLKAAFLHNISHEIRTPLNAIIGFSTLLGEPPDSQDHRQEYLTIITRNADRLLEIIDDVVEMSKIEAKTVQIIRGKVNLNLVLPRMYNQFRNEALRKGISLCFAIPPGGNDIEINTDGFKLTQVLRNLISNAIKFTNEGSVKFGYSVKEKKIEFYVSDTGIGIPVEHQANIFSRFYQVDSSSSRSYGGTGLGLSITKAYVELMGGEIWFTSQPGEGSAFSFTIPDNNDLTATG